MDKTMCDYIERKELMSARKDAIWVYENANIINASTIREKLKPLLDKIVDAPSVGIHNKHAKWEFKCYTTIWYGGGTPPEWVCSECGERTYNTYDYCPNCGAIMDLKG